MPLTTFEKNISVINVFVGQFPKRGWGVGVCDKDKEVKEMQLSWRRQLLAIPALLRPPCSESQWAPAPPCLLVLQLHSTTSRFLFPPFPLHQGLNLWPIESFEFFLKFQTHFHNLGFKVPYFQTFASWKYQSSRVAKCNFFYTEQIFQT